MIQMRIGLFFGSFNPIHMGHLIIANTILELSNLERVWFVVSPQNPFKNLTSLLHEHDRFEMVRLAIGDNPAFNVSDIEFRLPKPNYTIDTLTYLSEKYPKNHFSLLIGMDNLLSFEKWKNHKQILENYGLLVYPRPGYESKHPLLSHPNVSLIDSPLIDISASLIRNLVKSGRSIKYLVHQDVENHIKMKKFYLS
jgi:nicotinate-nucleotide adenylyltransferase